MEPRQIRGVLFDAFGTLCRIESPRLPYRSILKRWPQGTFNCYQALLTRDASLAEFAERVGLSQEELDRLEADIAAETGSMRLFSEAPRTLQALCAHGVKIGVVSNLAQPYGPPLLDLLPFAPDVRAFSYEVGAHKPQEAIYRQAWEELGCSPGELLMVGDSQQNDYLTPRELGLHALWLDRKEDMTPHDGGHIVNSLEGVLGYLGIV